MSKCDECPVHRAAVELHAAAKVAAGNAVKRSDHPSASTLQRDALREAVAEYEDAVRDILGLIHGCPEGEQPVDQLTS
ncbi:MAG TPA: hypothetical protein PK082_01690 [Phycisphaerae bacterium]|nr:hypothetical protein [Phycisphaerae bacterium]